MDKDSVKASFGRYLTKVRKERGLSIHQLAIDCDMEYSHLQRIEKGKVDIALTTMVAIFKGLELSAEEQAALFRSLK
ncbi:helix-turn-helix transcriptional regulator [Sediminibacterium sp.]|uniref:helix-turn-helix domain-containing protein n=1 Tax=Sediminibacterium sp. TaxID=1917865 RepID=UPI0025D0EC86|nr:helix-turn-helix transcriptional regulator [Sediminibacterium sp.]MBW0176912.1 helix-turn-helix domain-containing protein [Sediminibacterium sp.]